MNVTTIGIDLAKNSFSLHGVDARGKTVLHQTSVAPNSCCCSPFSRRA